MANSKKLKIDDNKYVIKATVFGDGDHTVSAPMDKAHADALAGNLKDAMKDIVGEYKAFNNIKVVKYDGEDDYEKDIVKNDPYGYSILDELGKKIDDKDVGKDIDFKIKDESGKSEKIKQVKFKNK